MPTQVKLTNKQSKFIDEYLIDLNATQAAIRAGYSEHTAGLIGCENIKKPNIRQEIDRRAAIISEKSHEKISYVISNLMELTRITDADKYQHRTKACELLGRYYGMYQDRVDVTSSGDRVSTVNITFAEVVKDGKTEDKAAG